MLKPHSLRHILHYKKPIVEDIIDYAVLTGKLELKNYWQNKKHYQRGVYTPPGMESIDPLREGMAAVNLIKAGLKSPQELAAARGRDFEEVINEIAEAKAYANSKGLDYDAMLGMAKVQLQTSPSALGASDTEQAKDMLDLMSIIDGGGNGKR